MTGCHVVLALALLLRVSALQAQPVAGNPSVPWNIKPSEGPASRAALPPAWRGEAGPPGADAAHADLPGDWAMPSAPSADKPFERQPEKVAPDALAAPSAVSTSANPPPQLDQALMEGVRVRLRNLGLLGTTDVSDAALAEAVGKFQVSINIPETGVLDRDTLGRLLVP